MDSSGPTTAGSIVAKLKMDRDQWAKDVIETKADSREIGALSPYIRVGTNVPEVLAQLEALHAAADGAGAVSGGSSAGASAGTAKTDSTSAAERRLALAISASESATQRAIVAQMKLEEQRERGRLTVAGLAAAELAAAEAIKRSEAAAEKAAIAEEALAIAERKAAASALEKAAAEEANAKSTIKANEANKTSASRVGMIAAAVAVLVPMLGPLAAFAIGGAGALTMMGAAGVLAIFGIKNEMASGTAAGAQFASGISTLKGNMSELSQTSALAMLGSFSGAVGLINADMPMLNRQVNLFAGLLGQSGTNLVTGALNGLRVLSPLFLSVGGYVDGLTAKFAKWTTDGGLQKFGNYAMSVLPQVEKFLGLLGTAVIKLLQAISAMGLAGMNVFGALFTVINALPVQVLADLIAAATWGVLAFKAWGIVAPILISAAKAMGALGIATQIASGPIGWITAGVSALVAVLAVSVSTANSASDAVDSYTAAVQADNGVIGENIRLQAAKNLQDDGGLKSAKALGIATDTLTKAALGNKDATKIVSAELDKQAEGYKQVSTGSATYVARIQALSHEQRLAKAAVENTRDSLTTQQAAVKLAIQNYNELQKALGGTTIATKAQLAAQQAQADAAGVSLSGYLQATAAQKSAARQYEQTTALMFLQGDAAGLLKQQIDLLNGKTIGAAQAQNQFDSQLANMSTHMDETGKVINRANTLLDGNTAAAVANRGELINLTTAAQNNAQAYRDAGHGAEDTRQKMIDMKQAIVDNAAAHGEDRDQVQSYVDTLYKIPDYIKATQIEVNTDAALAKLTVLRNAIEAFNTNTQMRIDMGITNAPNTVQRHASGGTVTGGGSATSDSVLSRLSVGEEVIRTASASQARPFLKAFNDNPAKALSAVAAAGSSGDTYNTRYNISGPDAASVAADVDRRQSLRLRSKLA